MRVFFLGALDTDRTVEERNQIIKAYYQTYQDQGQSSPDMHRMDSGED
jgi:hypothetical protein